jgi:DNA-binding winged helix-turn-helix (wHTH) protein
MFAKQRTSFELVPFRLDAAERLLYESDRQIALAPKALQTLLLVQGTATSTTSKRCRSAAIVS